MTPQEENLYSSLRREMDLLKTDIQAVRILSANDKSQPVSLPGQYRRKPIPSRLGVEIAVPARGTITHGEGGDFMTGFLPLQSYEGKIEIDSTGDFVATGLYIYFKFNSGSISGHFQGDVGGFWRHASSARILLTGGGAAIGIQDLYWGYEVSRTHLFRQNIPVPSYLPTMAEEGNGFFPLMPQDIFPAGEAVTVTITPTHPLFVDCASDEETISSGVFWCGFNGFYILGEDR